MSHAGKDEGTCRLDRAKRSGPDPPTPAAAGAIESIVGRVQGGIKPLPSPPDPSTQPIRQRHLSLHAVDHDVEGLLCHSGSSPSWAGLAALWLFMNPATLATRPITITRNPATARPCAGALAS